MIPRSKIPHMKDPPDHLGHGVLLEDKIEWFANQEQPLLISKHFDDKMLEAASYDLRLGDECYTGTSGRFELTPKDPILTIEPYDVAVVSTFEELRLPLYIVGRFNIRIGLIYRGVLLVTGPQVDPGFKGRLFTVLYNFSTQRIQLRLGEHIATIDFIRTTEPKVEEPADEKVETANRRAFEQKRWKLEDYLYGLESAPKRDLLGRLNIMEDRLERFIRLQWTILGGVILAIITVVVAVVFLLISVIRQV